MTYALYHIPGVKIGVTNDIKHRVEYQQGYSEGEYEILDMSDDIDYISKREVYLQELYGYRVDRQLYKDLFNNNFIELNNMKINITEATTTFPCPVDKLKGQLMDNLNMQWDTNHGTFTLTQQTINWIMNNVQTSMYNKNRSYVYNKALANFYDKDPHRNITVGETFEAQSCETDCDDCGDNIFNCIREWADKRGLYEKGDPKTQYIKLMEEAGEVGRAILKEDLPEIKDGIGDMVVVLTNLAELCGLTIEECVESAYDVISKRTGKMKNGTFVKD